ncbi:futalosine hydrolase [Thermodesulfovibrionales bacterium]|nr:futalosine hydrolase [Thermodesulfovibrionales bacterium]MCL0033706.1 futalosine hydrolase [Thermodesulfovibrionales bacterium]
MRSIGVIASTEIEVDLIIEQSAEKKKFLIQKKTFYAGILQSVPVIICICGVGKVNASHGTTLLLEKFAPAIVNIIGIAGAYPSSGLKIGDVVIADREIYGDEGLMLKNGLRIMNEIYKDSNDPELRFSSEFQMTIPNSLMNIISDPQSLISAPEFSVSRGSFVTVSACTGTLATGKEMEKRFGAICENMEGAAVAHICNLSEIPAIEMRGISNIIEDRTASPLDKAKITKASRNIQTFFLSALKFMALPAHSQKTGDQNRQVKDH